MRLKYGPEGQRTESISVFFLISNSFAELERIHFQNGIYVPALASLLYTRFL